MEEHRTEQRDSSECSQSVSPIERDEPLLDRADGSPDSREEVADTCVCTKKTKTVIFLSFALLLLLGVAFGFVDAEAFERVKPLLIALANKETRNDTLQWLTE